MHTVDQLKELAPRLINAGDRKKLADIIERMAEGPLPKHDEIWTKRTVWPLLRSGRKHVHKS